jgi:hypothetical protein
MFKYDFNRKMFNKDEKEISLNRGSVCERGE